MEVTDIPALATVKLGPCGQTDLQGLTWVGLAEAVLIWSPAGAFHWCTRAPVPASTTRTSRGVTCSSPSSSVFAQQSVCTGRSTLASERVRIPICAFRLNGERVQVATCADPYSTAQADCQQAETRENAAMHQALLVYCESYPPQVIHADGKEFWAASQLHRFRVLPLQLDFMPT